MQFQIPIASACSKGGLLEIKGHKPSISTAVFINLAIFTHINISVMAEVVVMLVCVCGGGVHVSVTKAARKCGLVHACAV